MYHTYWDLNSSPFQNGKGENWFYESPIREEALARLHFLIEERRRFGILSGAAGTGKSLLLIELAKQLGRSQREAVVIDVCGLSGDELLHQIADSLHLPISPDARPFVLWRTVRDQLYGHARSRQQTIFMFDHFNRGDADCERVVERLLHLEDNADGWHTVLVAVDGESSTQSTALLAELSDLRIELTPFDRHQTAYYVRQSLGEAGAERELFELDALEVLFALTGGVPRKINRLCELSLLAGMGEDRRTIDGETVVTAAADLAFQIPVCTQVRPHREPSAAIT